MTADDGNQPDPERQRLARSIFVPSSLDAVAEAVSVASENETRIYVERIGSSYRWSLTHPGGPYPLLRITARFLLVDYHEIVVGARAVADGVVVLCGDRETDTDPDAWALIRFNRPAQRANVAERIAKALAPK